MFFDSWHGLLRVLVVGVLAYVALVVLLRIFGKRTLSKMNAFDLVVTVALGSTLASILTSKDVALAEGVAAFAVLISLQFAVAWASVRWRWADRAVKSAPRLLAYRGEMIPEALRRERVSRDEVLAAVRDAGLPSLAEAEAVVLETAGEMSVVQRAAEGPADALQRVAGFDSRTVDSTGS